MFAQQVMSSSASGPLYFIKSKVNAAVYQNILEHFMHHSAVKLNVDADLIFQQDLAAAHTAKYTKTWFNDHGITVLEFAWPEPHRKCVGYCQEEDERHETNADELKATIEATWASITPQLGIDVVIHAKGASNKYENILFRKADISEWNFFFYTGLF